MTNNIKIQKKNKVLGRFEKFYSDREAQMIEGEDRHHTKLLSLL